jgi:hypothetical protein
MANGYLGKISAVVSANTADFQSKLNASAKDVQAFARSVQSNLTSASRDAAKSFESIYTPLQKFERSLQAAASMKLSFKGFAGAIKDVDVLRQRLGSMKDSQISLVLKASGMKNITDVREALVGLRAKDLQIVAKVGGIEKVRELRALSAEKRVDFAINLIDSGLGRKLADAKSKVQELKAAVASVRDGGAVPDGGIGGLASEYREATAEVRRLQELGRQSIKTTLGVNVQKDADVDRILQAGERAEAIRLPVLLDVLGEAAVKEAVTQSQRLRSVAEQINKPFGEAVGKLQAMSIETQAGLLPAFKRVQAQVESLKSNIESGVLPATAIAQQFDEVEKRALAAAGAVGRLAEAEQKTARLKTGRELAFAAPQLAATLGRGEEVGNRAASLPSSVIQANPRIAEMLTEIDGLANKAVAAFARLESRAAMGLDTSGSQKQVDALRAKLEVLFDEFDRTYQIHVDTEQAKKDFDELTAKAAAMRERSAFVITGRPQNTDQADGRRGQLEGDISGLDRAQRQNYKPLLEDAAMARQLGDLDKYNDALDKIAFRLAQDKRFNVTTAQAKKDLDDLKATMDSLRDESNFVISAKVQNAGQAEAEIKRIVGGMEQLDAAQRQSLQPKVDAAISSLGTKEIAIISAAIKDLDDEFEKEREIKVKADEAKKSIDKLKESLNSLADRIGNPGEPIDRLAKSIDAANAAIERMPAGALKTKLQADLFQEKSLLKNIGRPNSDESTPENIGFAADRVNAIAAAATPAKTTPNPLGADFGTAERSLASLQSGVMSLQSSLERLPLPMQAQFIPAINEVRSEFQKLTISSTADEIDTVVNKAKNLEVAFTRAGQAAKLGGTFEEALNAAAITKTEKQLGFIRSKLLEVGATASGPVAAAFNAYSAAAAAAANAGISGTAATTKQLDGLIAKIGEALVAEGKLTAAQGKAFSKNVGDVGRAGADKFALAMNQAAFAIDDFLSSTGGLEFKLRAISNNVTQLAFILGGTTGLWVGLGAVIGGQVAIGLAKWINEGRSAEDQTKALNEALARQKSLVEELAQAFGSLGDAMSRGTFSSGGEQAAEFSRQIEDIKKKQREARESTVVDLDPEVARERANQNKLRKDLESETDIGRRTAIQAQIRASQDREKEKAGAALERTPSAADVVGAIERARDVVESDRARRTNADPGRFTPEEIERRRGEAVAGINVAAPRGDADNLEAQRRALEKQIADLRDDAAGLKLFGFGPEADRAAEQRNNLEVLLASLELPLRKAIDDLANSVAEASRGPAAQIRQAQEDVAEAIRRGVPNAAAFQRELDANAKKLKEAYVSLEEAQKETDPDKKRAKVDEAKANIDQVEAEGADIRLRSREMRLGRTFGGERTTAALASIQGNERFGGDEYSIRTTAYIEAAIDREIEARGQLEVATAKGSDAEIKAAEAELEAAQRASEAAAAFGEAAVAVEAALARIRKVGDSALQRSEQGADAAQKAFEENPLRAGNVQSRDDAERTLIDDRARVAQAQADLRRSVQNDPQMQGISKELEAITQRRADLEAKARVGVLAPAEQRELDASRKREIELTREREQAALKLTEAERKHLDAINNSIVAREKELEKERQRAAEEPTFRRQMDAANRVIADSERQASDAQQRFINNPTEMTRKERDEADARLREDRERAQGLQDDLERRRREMTADPEVVENDLRIAENSARLAQLAGKEATTGLTEDEIGERKFLQRRNRERRADNEAIFARELQTEQKAIDDELIAQNQRDRALRGRDLGMTERERFRKDFAEGSGADINARAKELRDQGVNPQAFLRQALKNQMEQVAPMLQQFQEERQNALLQGPSRAALNVSDVSTSQGQSELNRLLRGDDSAKDVNLAELRKQSGYLEDIARNLKENNPGVLL